MLAETVRLPLTALALAGVALVVPWSPSAPGPSAPAATAAPVAAVVAPLAIDELVPLAGAPVADAQEQSGYHRCVPFLAAIVRRRDWRLTIAEHASSCTESHLVGSFAVDRSGGVAWTVPDLPVRSLALTADELAQLVHLDAVDCVRLRNIGYGERSYRIAVGDDIDAPGGAYVPTVSDLGHALDGIFEAAITRYDALQLAALEPIALRLESEDGVIQLAGHALTLRDRAGKAYRHDELDDRELVDVVDRLVAHPRGPDEDLHGTLHVGGRHIAITASRYGHAPDPVARLVRDLVWRS